MPKYPKKRSKSAPLDPDQPGTALPVYFVVPAYNEEQRLKALLDTYTAAFTHPDTRFHIIANNCRDRTAAVARARRKRDPRIIVTEIKAAIGKGGAIIEGFKRATGETIGFIDADGSVRPTDAAVLVEHLNRRRFDIVIGSRAAKGAVIEIKQPLTRQWLGRFFRVTIRGLFQFSYADTQCGAKFLTRTALDQILPQLREPGFAFDVDLLWQAKKRGLKTAELPIHWHDTPGSSVRPAKIIGPLVWSLIRIRLS